MSDGAELGAWVRLTQITGLGAQGARRLLEKFGLPQQVFAATPAALGEVLAPAQVCALLAPPTASMEALLARTTAWACEPGNRIMTLADADYPASLLDIPDPPILLYLKGRTELLSRPALAIVGSRNASVQGASNARQFARLLGAAGVTIVSGLALGIDTAAHEGSLAAGPGGGSTVAVVGTGIDIVYPARNHELAHRIAGQGCLVSEYALGTAGLPANFPRRNRLISGLAQGVLVVEAAERSGSLITARMALEQGRDVFAIPGSIHSALSKGCHQLIRQGAKLVESAEHVLEELPRLVIQGKPCVSGDPCLAEPVQGRAAAQDSAAALARQQPPQGDPACGTQCEDDEACLLELMGHDPVEAGQLAARCGTDTAQVMARLLALELSGMICRLPGGAYQRIFTDRRS